MEVANTPVTKRRWHTQGGFSAIELSVALSLAAIILAGASFNILNAMALEALDGWTRSATLDIAAAEQSAVTLRSTVNVTLTSTSYTLAVSGGGTFKVATLPKDLTITTTCASNVCSFDRHGVPSSAGTITLTSTRTGRTHVITIQSNTGSVSFQ